MMGGTVEGLTESEVQALRQMALCRCHSIPLGHCTWRAKALNLWYPLAMGHMRRGRILATIYFLELDDECFRFYVGSQLSKGCLAVNSALSCTDSWWWQARVRSSETGVIEIFLGILQIVVVVE